MMKRGMLVLLMSFFLISSLLYGEALSATAYPTRPITIIMWSPVGMANTLTRILAQNMEKQLGQPIIIEGKAGAAGAVAMSYILRSEPDGYTIGMAVTSNYIVTPHIRKVSYDMLAGVTDIVAICKYNFALVVRSDAPWNTFEDLLAYARMNPGKFTYSTSGVGVTQHIAMERIAIKEGIKWTLVPFKTSPEAVAACLGGNTDATVHGSVDVIPHLKAGKLKMLLSLDGNRWPDYPSVPDITEKYNFTAMSYISFIGPKGIPEEIRQKLEDSFKEAMKDPAFQKMIDQYKVDAKFIGGKDYTPMWRGQYEEMGKVLKALNLVEK